MVSGLTPFVEQSPVSEVHESCSRCGDIRLKVVPGHWTVTDSKLAPADPANPAMLVDLLSQVDEWDEDDDLDLPPIGDTRRKLIH